MRSCCSHLPSLAERPHIGPNFLDVVETLLLIGLLSDDRPAIRDLSVRAPDRVLFFVVHDNVVERSRIVVVHFLMLLQVEMVLEGFPKSKVVALEVLCKYDDLGETVDFSWSEAAWLMRE